MYKYIYIILITIATISYAKAGCETIKEPIYGKIKSISEHLIDDNQRASKLYRYLTYDINQNLLGEKIIGGDEASISEILCKYDTNLLEKEITVFQGKRNIINYKYNDNKIRTNGSVYDQYGKLLQYYEYKYDEKGNKIISYLFNPAGKKKIIWKYKYSKDRKLIENSSHFPDGTLRGLINRYIYDNNENIKEMMAYHDNKIMKERVHNMYDNRNNIQHTFVYDDSSNVISATHHKYDYDDKGNWVKRKIWIVDMKAETIKTQLFSRTLEYYPN